ncbi:two component LuxR family transcriptional regulator [Stanieria sp. NIES-3757]|nr:two component LuxR family transcriptional regulator [Stanieria sp. NIES-3757]
MIKILVVDDQNLVRQKLQTVFTTQSDFEIVGMVENGFQALEYLKTKNPDIALVDLEMPEMNGLTLTQIISQSSPQTQIIILSSCDDHNSINDAIQAGARGYLLKSTSESEIIDTVRYVQRGYFQLGPGLFEKLLFNLIDQDQVASGQLETLDDKYSYYVNSLKQEIELKTQTTHGQLTKEIESQVKNLQVKFKEGLEAFQQQVTNQLKHGLDDLINKFCQKQQNNLNQTLEEQAIINHQLFATKLLIKKLEKQITILRYGLIAIFFCYFLEKITILCYVLKKF